MTLIRIIIGCLVVLTSTQVFPGDKHIQAQIETLLGNVTRAVSSSRMEQPCVQKWVFEPVLAVPPDYEHIEAVKMLLEPVSSASALSIRIVSEVGLPGITLTQSGIATPGKKYKSQCSASRSVDGACRITGATITLPRGLDANQFAYCFTHELLHALGFQGHAWNMPSVMNPKAEIMEFTAWDSEVLERLYSDQIEPGDREAGLRAFLSGDNS